MKILTVSASPYLLVRNGRMNAALIKALKEAGHEVATAGWHHDEGFFLPEDGSTHWYEENGERICEIYPFEPEVQGSPTLYELMKKVQPDMVISIGDYKETSFIFEVKAMIPNMFKWMAVFAIDSLPINKYAKEQIEYADYVVSVNDFGDEALRDMLNVDIDKIEFGPKSVFSGENEGSISFINTGKNAQASNVGAFIKAMGQNSESGPKGYLHTNLYDPGDYDLDLLIDNYGADNVELPDRFISVKEALSDEELAEEYCKHTFVVETSVKSASALAMLEAMACGCIPVGMNSGRVGEIISQFENADLLTVPHEIYIGASEEEFSVISIEGLSNKIQELYKWAQEEPSRFQNMSEEARKIASSYSEEAFCEKMLRLIDRVSVAASKVAVDTF